MSKIQELHQQLDRWNAHNEVRATAADRELYLFLKNLLKLAEGEDEGVPEPESEVETIQNADNESISSFDAGSDDAGPGGNNPGSPNIP